MKLFDWILTIIFLLTVLFFFVVRAHSYQLIILNRTDLPEKCNIEQYDIVEVMPDSFKPEGHVLDKAKFLIIKIPNDTKDVGKFMEPDRVNDKARLYKVNIASMTTTERTNFADNKLTLTKTKAEKLIVKKTTATVEQ